ncbi:hypothetical protein E2C01_068688 [Portunus trituberculatus]|uniref:Uncharacterized protein n=1 Tax=Portunus trituberculatus TaxID=210409 RepID=A0A5B7HN11_PORTR|nr:hypothetical protein [Portunus trituberculatus]
MVLGYGSAWLVLPSLPSLAKVQRVPVTNLSSPDNEHADRTLSHSLLGVGGGGGGRVKGKEGREGRGCKLREGIT